MQLCGIQKRYRSAFQRLPRSGEEPHCATITTNGCLATQSGEVTARGAMQTTRQPGRPGGTCTLRRRRSGPLAAGRGAPAGKIAAGSPLARSGRLCLRVYAWLFVHSWSCMHRVCLWFFASQFIYLSMRSHVRRWVCIGNTWAAGSAAQHVPRASRG